MSAQKSLPLCCGFGLTHHSVTNPGNADGQVLCRMFNQAASAHNYPTFLGYDIDTLFKYHLWKANQRVLELDEIKSLPHAPLLHPFVERLIGSIRRGLLDQTLFWTATDLKNKLLEYQCSYKEYRTHSGLDGGLL